MPTILFIFGFRFVIYTRDHNPAHVHALKNDNGAKIGIFPDVYLIENRGLTSKDLKIALSVTEEYKEDFLIKWQEYHGDNNTKQDEL